MKDRVEIKKMLIYTAGKKKIKHFLFDKTNRKKFARATTTTKS